MLLLGNFIKAHTIAHIKPFEAHRHGGLFGVSFQFLIAQGIQVDFWWENTIVTVGVDHYRISCESDRKNPPPGGVSYLLCSLIKNPEEEDPPRSTWWRFARKKRLPTDSSARVIYLRFDGGPAIGENSLLVVCCLLVRGQVLDSPRTAHNKQTIRGCILGLSSTKKKEELN